ncbi:TetR/AcrR family transcriptional regulator [Hespellia stercorisuis]|uniref:Transcriptional regulator, TetR family n=1 Tax=Hespellia stercorisuis DSM 15480 TaxID=1121950 RepID=A0A1M6U595_9FIRM|nr:TetR/AcrR family transcriptional regulator [Hespellia stercorisuis]SHK64340.1 transcriptional regulator, TetR family [Hespellia stercorisuis DSM 15480]
MYRGNNPSAMRSREWIREALIRLLSNQRYAKISIKEICSEADLSRQTFYQIYESKDEIMAYHFECLFLAFKEECADFKDISIREITTQFFTFFYEEKSFVKILIENKLTFYLEEMFEQYLPRIDIFKKYNEKEANPDYTIAFVSGALTQILIHWFDKDFNLTIDEIARETEETIMARVIGQSIIVSNTN